MKVVRSKNNSACYELNKVSLSCYDDKRYILHNGISTLVYRYQRSETQELNLSG